MGSTMLSPAPLRNSWEIWMTSSLLPSRRGTRQTLRVYVAARGALIVIAAIGGADRSASANDPSELFEPIPRTAQDLYQRDYSGRLPSLGQCDALARKRRTFGDVTIHFHWAAKDGIAVKTTKSLGAEIERCVEQSLHQFANTLHDKFGRNDDFTERRTLGQVRSLLPDDENFIVRWLETNDADSPTRKAAAARALKRRLPANVALVDGCLAVSPPSDGLGAAMGRWLERHAAPVAPFWDKGSLSALKKEPDTRVLVLASPSPHALMFTQRFHEIPGLPIGSGPSVHKVCSVRLDDRWINLLKQDMAATGRCWSSGPVEAMVKPRFRFPGGRTYAKVRTTNRGRACALSSQGEVTCCGPTVLDIPGQHRDLDTEGDLACTVSKAGVAACFDLETAASAVTLPGHFQQISAGHDGICGVTTAGKVVCGPPGARLAAPPSGSFRAVDATASCGIANDGELLCWSSAGMEHIGKGPWQRIAADKYGLPVACALTSAGAVWCWETADARSSLRPVETKAPLAEIQLGTGERCGIGRDCHLQCWEGRPPIDDRFGCVRDAALGNPFCAIGEAGQIRCWHDDFWSGPEHGAAGGD
jgi:hypothetical protein